METGLDPRLHLIKDANSLSPAAMFGFYRLQIFYGRSLAFLGERSQAGGGGGWLLRINGLMGMCRLVGSHFHHWISYNGVAFSTEFPTELLEWGRKLSAFWEERC